VFEGEADAVEAMVAWCREGPPRARIRAVERLDELPGAESGFRVR
jgi:acylphosphatase